AGSGQRARRRRVRRQAERGDGLRATPTRSRARPAEVPRRVVVGEPGEGRHGAAHAEKPATSVQAARDGAGGGEGSDPGAGGARAGASGDRQRQRDGRGADTSRPDPGGPRAASDADADRAGARAEDEGSGKQAAGWKGECHR
ncbi:MAG: hypothetical protein M3511_13945, partial [Deinococcota bacterium]|nr:hypothetical protein [Deinococcota bacterium]